MTWLALIIVVVMLVAAASVLLMKSHVAAVAAASVVSLAVSVLFVMLHAPDVAMTEATVGAGLSSLILALGVRKLQLWQADQKDGEGGS